MAGGEQRGKDARRSAHLPGAPTRSPRQVTSNLLNVDVFILMGRLVLAGTGTSGLSASEHSQVCRGASGARPLKSRTNLTGATGWRSCLAGAKEFISRLPLRTPHGSIATGHQLLSRTRRRAVGVGGGAAPFVRQLESCYIVADGPTDTLAAPAAERTSHRTSPRGRLFLFPEPSKQPAARYSLGDARARPERSGLRRLAGRGAPAREGGDETASEETVPCPPCPHCDSFYLILEESHHGRSSFKRLDHRGG